MNVAVRSAMSDPSNSTPDSACCVHPTLQTSQFSAVVDERVLGAFRQVFVPKQYSYAFLATAFSLPLLPSVSPSHWQFHAKLAEFLLRYLEAFVLEVDTPNVTHRQILKAESQQQGDLTQYHIEPRHSMIPQYFGMGKQLGLPLPTATNFLRQADNQWSS